MSGTATKKDLEDAFDQTKALLFLDVKTSPDFVNMKKYVAYTPLYTPELNEARKIAKGSSILPYRQEYTRGKNDGSMKPFKDTENQTVREFKNYGTKPVKNLKIAGNTQNPFPKFPSGVLLHFYIVRDADKYPTGVQVGIAQVSAEILSNGKIETGRLTLPIYRVGAKAEMLYPNSLDDTEVQIRTNAAYVATRGGAPTKGKGELADN